MIKQQGASGMGQSKPLLLQTAKKRCQLGRQLGLKLLSAPARVGRDPASGLGLGYLCDLAALRVRAPHWNQIDGGSHRPHQVASLCHTVHDCKTGLARLSTCWPGRGLQAACGAPVPVGDRSGPTSVSLLPWQESFVGWFVAGRQRAQGGSR